MSYGLGFFMGLGQAANRENESRAQQEEQARKEALMERSQRLGMFQKLVESEDFLPDEARNAAARHWAGLTMNPKAKPKDFDNALSEVMALAARPRQTPKSIAETANARAMEQAGTQAVNTNPMLQSLSGIAGRDFSGGLNSIIAGHRPPVQNVSGILTREEIDARALNRQRNQMQLATESALPKFQSFNATDGLYDPRTGKIIRQPVPAQPRPDTSLTPFEVAMQLAGDDPVKRAQVVRDFTPRSVNSGQVVVHASNATNPGAAIQFQNPDGTISLVYPKMLNQNGQPVVDLPGNLRRPLNDTAMGTKADLTDSITKLDKVLKISQANPDVFGAKSGIGYSWRTSALGQIFGVDPPDADTTDARTGLALVINNELHKLSGAAISASEWARLKRGLPTGNEPNTQQKIEALLASLRRIYQLRYGAGGRGGPDVTGDVDVEMMSSASPARNSVGLPAVGANSAPPPPPGARIIR